MLTRRRFLQAAAVAAAGAAIPKRFVSSQEPGERPQQDRTVSVELPRLRVPLSLIIDDSTCLVNLNRFAIPQFAEAWRTVDPSRYQHDWRSMPHEIPDAFVRKFGEWCAEHAVKGKYSVVPYPACVGRLDRVLPGWTQQELDQSIELVRSLMMPNWDIHPEMVTHTWAIDLKTGHPYPERSIKYMENWDFSVGKSADELASYMAYALQILKNIGLPCEGITTPGGFGNRVLPQLAQATLEACRDVFQAEIPHYFRHLYDSGPRSVAPRVEYAAGLDTDAPRCVVSIIGCTGDWTGGWDCSNRGYLDRFITPDLQSGRMVEVIERGEPACIVCHWTGIYFNGEEVGFKIFQEVVRRLHARFDNIMWMKLSEIARYWAAKELTGIERHQDRLVLRAPFGTPHFTLTIQAAPSGLPRIKHGAEQKALEAAKDALWLQSGQFLRRENSVTVCFDLPRGTTEILFQ
ncbi:MAG: hypothetical protein KatS3mg110_2656 [Pirellulaceae bacterium]|nr:MAG: hypothetical protein KatS3mg110_2656 [Pirellulaceae bacterium]